MVLSAEEIVKNFVYHINNIVERNDEGWKKFRYLMVL